MPVMSWNWPEEAYHAYDAMTTTKLTNFHSMAVIFLSLEALFFLAITAFVTGMIKNVMDLSRQCPLLLLGFVFPGVVTAKCHGRD